MPDRPYILLVDDDRQVLRYLKAALADGGYDVTVATSGKRALEIIQDRMPDLLILDLNMPEPDGFDVLKQERSQYPHLRTIVISGYLQGALLHAAKLFGATATLEKPIAPDALVAKVREILGSPSQFPSHKRLSLLDTDLLSRAPHL
jgi:CheY-like chemotaxis protein